MLPVDRHNALAGIEQWLVASPKADADTYPELSATEIAALLDADADVQKRIRTLAAALRDTGLSRAGRAGVITYSRKAFIPITNLCRDRCHYCTFVETPNQLKRQGKALFMSPDRILAVARQAVALNCKEALFTLGDRPEARWPEAREWLNEHGYASTLDYVREMAELVRRETGILPHLNPGVMTHDELSRLRPVAPSMGLMLETTSRALFETPGAAHFGSPDKDPAVRLEMLRAAGELNIPTTSGLLIGIGETRADRADSIVALRDLHREFGHLQEIIVQNFRAKPATAMQATPDLEVDEYLTTLAVSRLAFGPDMRIQAPPNLAEPESLAPLLQAGVDDWGGVSPLTADHVNPERPWPNLDRLAQLTAEAGFELRERLTVHPAYIRDRERWLSAELSGDVLALADSHSFLARSVAESDASAAANPARTNVTPMVRSTGVRAALSRAAKRPSELDDTDYAELLHATGAQLDELCALADDLRRYTVGEVISLVRNRAVDLTRVAALSADDLAEIAHDTVRAGCSELCIQGLGSAPPERNSGGRSLVDIASVLHEAEPALHLHAFRPAELIAESKRQQISIDDLVAALREAGVGTIPGSGVKILDEQLRSQLFPADLETKVWLSTVAAAHRGGLRSSSVLGYGYGETAAHRVTHLRALAALQERTGGFTECVLMPTLAHPVRLVAGRTVLDEHRAMHAVARLILHGRIPHIQVAWARHAEAHLPVLLRSGADDLGGTLIDGTVLPEFSAVPGSELDEVLLRSVTRALGRASRVRTTTYNDGSESSVAVATS